MNIGSSIFAAFIVRFQLTGFQHIFKKIKKNLLFENGLELLHNLVEKLFQNFGKHINFIFLPLAILSLLLHNHRNRLSDSKLYNKKFSL